MLHIKLECPPVLLLCADTKPWKLQPFSERGERLTVNINKVIFTKHLGKKIVDLICSEFLTKDTTISQKCQENVSKIAQRHEYRLPSAATNKHLTCFAVIGCS